MTPSSSLFLVLLDNIDIGVFVLDANGQYLYVNRAYCELTKKEPDFFENMSIPLLKQHGYLSRTVWEQVVEKQQQIYSVITITDKNLNRAYDTLTTGTPFFDDQGMLQYVFCTQESLTHLNTRIQRGMMNKAMLINLNLDIEKTVAPVDIIAESPQMIQLLTLLRSVARTDASILVSGPSGSGKEVVARYIHRASPRSKKPLVAVNCAAIPENLMESELFGYERGAFTGAAPGGKPGLIEAADGGTLFLDEINSMPPSLQTRFLRVLETRQITRIGAVLPKKIDFRLICASNEDLHTLVQENKFRSDLFYRINVISVYVPPLCERRDDIIPLSLHYLQHYCEKYECVKILSNQVLQAFHDYAWPGNIRELKNMIERLVITSPEPEWQIESIPTGLMTASTSPNFSTPPMAAAGSCFRLPEQGNQQSYQEYMDNCERTLLLQALKRFHTPTAIAKALDLDLSTVYRKIKKHHLSLKS